MKCIISSKSCVNLKTMAPSKKERTKDVTETVAPNNKQSIMKLNTKQKKGSGESTKTINASNINGRLKTPPPLPSRRPNIAERISMLQMAQLQHKNRYVPPPDQEAFLLTLPALPDAVLEHQRQQQGYGETKEECTRRGLIGSWFKKTKKNDKKRQRTPPDAI